MIVLGVGFVAGTMIMGATMNQAYFDSFAAVAAPAARPLPFPIEPNDRALDRVQVAVSGVFLVQ